MTLTVIFRHEKWKCVIYGTKGLQFLNFTTNQILNCSVTVFQQNSDMSTDDTFSTTVLSLDQV